MFPESLAMYRSLHSHNGRDICSESSILTSLIHQLPTELLLEIFSWCHPLGLHIATGEKPSTVALSLAQTCSRWREICLGCPALWSNINVNLVDVGLCSAYFVKLYLRNSRDAPLALTISDFEFGEDEMHAEELEDVAYDILASLAAACSRWFQVNINVAWNFFDDPIAFPVDTSGVPASFPLLESLSLQWEPVSSVAEFCRSNVLFDKLAFAENLRDLEITSFNTMIPIPLQKLTRVAVWSLTNSSFHQLLSCCQNLEYISVDHLVLSPIDCPAFSSCSSLQNARLSFEGDCQSIDRFFGSITLPSLHDLHIQASPGVGFPLDSLTRMLRRSDSAKELLELSLNTLAKDTDLLNLLSFTTNLRQLRIHTYFQLTSHLFSRLTFPDGTESSNQILIPNLNALYVACHSFAEPIGLVGVEMAESRFLQKSRFPQSFHSLTLHLPRRNRQLPTSMSMRLERLAATGLNLRII
ncbi:hypothetical protein GYMLUDRAFT_80438 [Collybiopsis luxurians FD-317 M1]|nr:hypothetical protein GYMLUDRAFT_80438 [Collybiopsis luxurians FD-317 M1]